GNRLFGGLPSEFAVGRYHSLYARKSTLPAELSVAAETADGIIMAIEHKTLPIAAVQFHPESVMTSPGAIGMPIITAMLSTLCAETVK
ncbi:MAG TPA: gamma-glutamyl-gamma-aminobutyrate hydrolase family protein, partial [Stellaceae bacterium]|nr:gamma-glutamyl-gamma-aminobutyrate hydrolase family protein [Stellaceae bacterium]